MSSGPMFDFIVSTIQTMLEEKASDAAFEPDTNLIFGGILDSLEFINLLMALESEFDLDIDFSDLDPAEFTTINGLVLHLTPKA